ncbi:hypothetical protein PC9H_007804 [Pleurotus ostreatus]|uniref:DNA repair protein Rad26 n=1 Tax=Pleurotus ostreatus TaxID=5322 RepID=A0A8H6ZW02_PLEOS|nr:uncharacterized protein PC9H_007804 [Pleurotus ostreatus]KAF7428578.1 hypothetical protein PC9H_007804 [Pleurotus ostreatus]
MADSDDFLFDDVELDDTTLAALDEAEKTYFSNTSTGVHLTTPPTPPPAKRLKTAHRVATRQIDQTASLDNVEDLPDISIQEDGTYGLGPTPPDSDVRRRLGESVTSQERPVRQEYSPRPARAPYASNVASSSHAKPQSARTLAPIPPTRYVQHEQQIGMGELQKQIEELQRQQAQMQAELKQAVDARLTKEGEVSVLRKAMEKTSRDHSAELSKLRAAKEEADAKQRKTQQAMREEMESLKTQFIFKQQEQLSAMPSLKAPSSVRSKKIANMPSSTALHPLSQAGAWNRDGSNVAGPSNKIFETPRRPRHLPSTQRLTPKRLQPPKSPEKMRQSALLPGFENAFMPSSPVAKTQIQSDRKGKQKAIDLLKDDSDGVVERDGLDLWERADAVIPPFPLARAARSEAGDMDVDSARPTEVLFDVPMTDEVAADVPLVVEEGLDDVKPFDWSAEVGTCSIDFSSAHVELRLAVKDRVYTYGYLVNNTDLAGPDGSQFPSDTTINTASVPFHEVLETVLCAFIDMIYVLMSANLIPPLATLLDLITLLDFSLPNVSNVLLAQQSEDPDRPTILVHLKAIITQYLRPAVQVEEKMLLARGTIGLLEALCWNVSEESITRMSVIASDSDMIPILLDRSQPDDVLSQTIRFLALLATHDALRRVLLTVPPDAPANTIPLVERTSTYLVDQREGPEADYSRTLLICFFGTLATTIDCASILAASPVLVPALISYVANLVSPIWEDDKKYLDNPSLADCVIRTLGDTLCLLHHLVFSTQPPLDLLLKLQQAPPRYFNGANHVFIVAFGRLSYADPPSWMNKTTVIALERVIDMAKDLLEHVVDGPEGDAIWEVYQGNFDNASETDEGDMEAQLLGTAPSGD